MTIIDYAEIISGAALVAFAVYFVVSAGMFNKE
jgi:hypothetical protein